VHIKIAFRGATVKELRMAWQHALRQGNKRLVTRISALLHLSDGVAVAEAAERVGAGESTVHGWLRAFILRGVESLRYGASPGRPCKLTPTQRDRLKELVAAGPLAAGYPSGCWSSLMLQDLVYREFGRCDNAHYLCTLLSRYHHTKVCSCDPPRWWWRGAGGEGEGTIMIAPATARRFRGDRPHAGRDGIAQQRVHGPCMVGQPSGHGWRSLLPLAPPDGAQTQALVGPAEVVGQPTSHIPLSTSAVPCAMPRPRRVKGARCARKVAFRRSM